MAKKHRCPVGCKHSGFKSQSALNMHIGDKHPNWKAPKITAYRSRTSFLALLTAGIIGGLVALYGPPVVKTATAISQVEAMPSIAKAVSYVRR